VNVFITDDRMSYRIYEDGHEHYVSGMQVIKYLEEHPEVPSDDVRPVLEAILKERESWGNASFD
jgi:hypothetical protein